MATIIPAILEETKEKFNSKVFALTRIPGVKRLQVDFGDGLFVPHKTLDIGEIEALNPVFEWEAHIMAEQPKNFLDYQIAGFRALIIHYEAFPNEAALRQALGEIIKLGLKSGLAINPQTPIAVLVPFADLASIFTILSVEPGFQGSSFIPASIDRVSELRRLLPNAILEVDGGVNLDNAHSLIIAGADQLVVGSALFATDSLEENFTYLVQVASK